MSDEMRMDLARQMVTVLPRYASWAKSIQDVNTPYGKLGFRQLAILWALRYNQIAPDELSPTRLAELHNVRPSVVTRALTRLEEGGFIQRAMDLQDRRRINITLTGKGREASIYVEQLYLRQIKGSMTFLDDTQVDDLMRYIGILADIVDDLEARGHLGTTGEPIPVT